MPTSSDVLEKKRLKMPWQEISLPDDVLPWQERQWTFDIGAGFFRDCGIKQNHSTGEVEQFYKPKDWPLQDGLTYDDLVAIQSLCAETDCSFAEAMLQHKGEDEFPAKWLNRLRAGTPMYLDGAERKSVVEAPRRAKRAQTVEDQAKASILTALDDPKARL
jgi:hypothetical protein